MTTLAIEFSTDRRSVAVVRDGSLLAEVVHQATRTTPVFAMIADVLARAGVGRDAVGCIAVGIGPGSYTGVRLAISVAQGWQLANGAKVAAVTSFDAMAVAAKALTSGPVLLAADAQRGEFAVALAEHGRLMEPIRLAAGDVLKARIAAGESVAGPEVLRMLGGGSELFPAAADIARAAEERGVFVAAESLAPVYLREAAFVKAPPMRVV
jgi:tRNA threonylcarbamoyladenosine biosynthesis protein TsaB